MNLQDEFYLGTVFLDVLVYIYHGYFNQVSGRALYNGIDGGSLGQLFLGSIVGMDIADGASAAEDGLHEACFLSLFDAVVDKLSDALVALVILLDEIVGFSVADAQALR